ncbi:MAG: tail fiber domain-containing protein [Phycisphaerae bacterium]|nr:tail fiber domain-containing protein [Phycisphaerae bacterium]
MEVYGFYWGGACPKQYCSRVQILEKTDSIVRLFCCPDNDWLVSGGDMHSIPSGKVGIGTAEPDKKLHVLGDVLIEGQGPSWSAASLTATHQGEGRQIAAYFSNPQDGSAEVDVQWTGGTMLPWGWSLKAASGMFTLGSIMVLPPALNITSTGRVGLGVTSPTHRLELPNTAGSAGSGLAYSWSTYSSGRWKTNVQSIERAMDKVRQLRGVTFDWKDGGRHDMGLIAEEVGKVVPEVVNYEANGGDASSMDYSRLVALLVEALKEQDARIAELEQALESRNPGQGASLEEGGETWAPGEIGQ